MDELNCIGIKGQRVYSLQAHFLVIGFIILVIGIMNL